jgi:hypothetical protein
MTIRMKLPPGATHLLIDVRDGTEFRVAFNIESFSVSQRDAVVPAWLQQSDLLLPQRGTIHISGEVFSVEHRVLPDKPEPKRKRK